MRRSATPKCDLAPAPPGGAGEQFVRAEPAASTRRAGASRRVGPSAWPTTPSSPILGRWCSGVEIIYGRGRPAVAPSSPSRWRTASVGCAWPSSSCSSAARWPPSAECRPLPEPTLDVRGGGRPGPASASAQVRRRGRAQPRIVATVGDIVRHRRADEDRRRCSTCRRLPGRPRPGRPGHPPAPARTRGGRDDRGIGARAACPRWLHGDRGHAQHGAGDRLGRRGLCPEVLALQVSGCRPRWPGRRRHHRRAGSAVASGAARRAKAWRDAQRSPLFADDGAGRAGRRASCGGHSTTRGKAPPPPGGHPGPALRRTTAPPRHGGAMHEGPGRAVSASRASRRRPRRPWSPATSRCPA